MLLLELLQGGASQALNDQIRRAIVELPDVERAGDVRAVEASAGLDLTEEALDGLSLCEQRGQQELDGDLSL